MLAGLLALSPATAALASNPGKTFTFHDQVDTFTDVVPCTTIAVTVTTVSNGVEHFQVTTMPGGSVRAQGTFTQTGTFQAVRLDGSGITYSGHFTAWDGVGEEQWRGRSSGEGVVRLNGAGATRNHGAAALGKARSVPGTRSAGIS